MLDAAAGNVRSKPGIVLHGFRPGEGVNYAESLAEPALDFCEHRVVLVLADRVVIPRDAAEQRDGIEQLVERDGLIGCDRTGDICQSVERVRYLLVPHQLV